MKTLYISIVLVIIFGNSFSQQLPQYSLHTFDQLAYNPAIAGSNSYPEVKLHHRSQWVGFSGAPRTSLLSYHYALSNKTGLGGYVINDATGPIKRTALNLSYAHHIATKTCFIAFGLSANGMQYSLNGDIDIKEQNDVIISENMSDKAFIPDFSFGTLIYNQNFYVGASIMQLLAPKAKLDLSQNTAVVNLNNHFYLSGGYNYFVNNKFMIEPSVLLYLASSGPPSIDLSVKGVYKNEIIGGLTYRYQDAISMILGYRYKRYLIAYSYDLVTTGLRKSNSGSHEIIIGYHWPLDKETKPMYDLKGTFRGQIKKRIY